MKAPSFADSFEVLCLLAADDKRNAALFGNDVPRARETIRPFVVGTNFPGIYFEFPLMGRPFMDVTVLYNDMAPGTRVASPAAAGCEDLLDWFAGVRAEHDNINIGFEVDTSSPELKAAAVHFQPREHKELVRPFFETIGEPERSELYLGLDERMPEGWEPAFCGLFRGRPNAPLRVCGYIDADERMACAQDPSRVAAVFDRIGFSAYDSTMLGQINAFMKLGAENLDYQVDVLPDGTLSDMFALDIGFKRKTADKMQASFRNGYGARLLGHFEELGISDERWKLIADATFARGIPIEKDDGSLGSYAFMLMPAWSKVRWRGAALQPGKFYYAGVASELDDTAEDN